MVGIRTIFPLLTTPVHRSVFSARTAFDAGLHPACMPCPNLGGDVIIADSDRDPFSLVRCNRNETPVHQIGYAIDSIYRRRIEDDEVAFWKLVFSGIRHRRVRVGLNCTVIAVPLTLVLTVVGFHPPARNSPRCPSTHQRTSRQFSRYDTHVRTVSDPSGFQRLLTELVEVILIASVAVTFLSMWANVLYRNHEIGILRSLGGSKVLVIGIVSMEAALIGVGGAIPAVLFSQSILHGLNFLSAAAPAHGIGWKWCLITPCIVASIAVVGNSIACSLSVQEHVLDMVDDD